MLHYVGRYTHRVAISNNRLLDIEHDQVAFAATVVNGDVARGVLLLGTP